MKKPERNTSTGMTLMELLVGVGIIITLASIAGSRIRGLVQRAKISAAETTVDYIALSLNTIKNDAGFYPAELSDMNQVNPPEGFKAKNWYGPYGQGLSLTDPWNNPYFYQVTEGIVCGPDIYKRYAPPHTDTINFSAIEGKGTIIVTSTEGASGMKLPKPKPKPKHLAEPTLFSEKAGGKGGKGPGTTVKKEKVITAGRIWLNGVEIISPNEFGKGTITKSIFLSSDNKLEIRVTSNPVGTMTIKITSPFSTDSTFTLGSYGRDKNSGGTKWDADIIYGES